MILVPKNSEVFSIFHWRNNIKKWPMRCAQSHQVVKCLKKHRGELGNSRLVRERKAKNNDDFEISKTFRYKEFCFSRGSGFRYHGPTQKTNITHNIICHNHMTRFRFN